MPTEHRIPLQRYFIQNQPPHHLGSNTHVLIHMRIVDPLLQDTSWMRVLLWCIWIWNDICVFSTLEYGIPHNTSSWYVLIIWEFMCMIYCLPIHMFSWLPDPLPILNRFAPFTINADQQNYPHYFYTQSLLQQRKINKDLLKQKRWCWSWSLQTNLESNKLWSTW